MKYLIIIIIFIGCSDKTYINQYPEKDPEIIEVINIKERYTNIKSNECKKISDDIYIENNSNGNEFDVYYNKQCRDSLGEYCNNVKSYDSNALAGKFESCLIKGIELTGEKRTDKSIRIRILEFLNE